MSCPQQRSSKKTQRAWASAGATSRSNLLFSFSAPHLCVPRFNPLSMSGRESAVSSALLHVHVQHFLHPDSPQRVNAFPRFLMRLMTASNLYLTNHTFWRAVHTVPIAVSQPMRDVGRAGTAPLPPPSMASHTSHAYCHSRSTFCTWNCPPPWTLEAPTRTAQLTLSSHIECNQDGFQQEIEKPKCSTLTNRAPEMLLSGMNNSNKFSENCGPSSVFFQPRRKSQPSRSCIESRRMWSPVADGCIMICNTKNHNRDIWF